MMAEEIKIPSREEIEKLPRLAQVAFAARCARRSFPFYQDFHKNSKFEQIDSVLNSVQFSELIGSGSSYTTISKKRALELVDEVRKVYEVEKDLVSISYKSADDPEGYTKLYTAIDSVNSAEVAYYAARVAIESYLNNSKNIDDTISVINYSLIESKIVKYATYAAAAIRYDYELLLIFAEKENWDDNTPVKPEFFGPLWRYGVPKGFPYQPETDEGYKLVVEIEVDEDADEATLKQQVDELSLRLNELHHAYGGSGLIVDKIDLETSVPELVEV